jgi:hypothetical protein
MSRRHLVLPLVLAAVAGCSRPAAPPAAPETPAQNPPQAAADPYAQPDSALQMSEINLYMHRSKQMEGVAQKPEFWVHATAFTMQGQNAYAFQNARAVVYSDEEGREDVVIDAMRGTFEQDRRAVLQDDVRVKAGTLLLNLSDITWEKPEDGSPGVARSDNHVTINDPSLQLEAASLRLYPDSKLFELTAVTGTVRFGKDSL